MAAKKVFGGKGGFEVDFSPKRLALLLSGWLVLTDLLVGLVYLTDAWPLKVLVFISLSLLPGLVLLRALRVSCSSVLEGLLYSLGLSLLVLMASGLAANQILYRLGVQRPLELAGILGALNMVVVVGIGGGLVNHQTWRLKVLSWPKFPKTNLGLAVVAALLPGLAALGAFRLNNGGDALVAMGAIVAMSGVFFYAFLFRDRLSEASLVWVIFTIGLAILLMTSLRSWDISGHDIAREFHVYNLTHIMGRWDISSYRDPYNACLSITILPEVFAKLLHVSGMTSFKLLLQIIFAVCPGVIYVLLRRYVSKLGALVGCGLFISYPTFINDSAMLTRQGIAYLFFALALLAALHTRAEKIHKPLFLLCGLGVVVSHYSTSYMFIALFALALGCKLLIGRLRGWKMPMVGNKITVLSPAVLGMLALATFLWYFQFTATAGGLATTLTHSASNLPRLLSDDNKSSDTSAALLLASHKSQLDIYQSYLAHPQTSDSVVDAPEYRPEITTDDLPVTSLGQRLQAWGLSPSITTDLRQNFAKILQLLAGVSVFCTTYVCLFYSAYARARKKPFALPFDLICLNLAGIILLAFMVGLPNLSLSYGVLRTFQQSLIFLVVPLTLMLTLTGRWLRPQLRLGVATASIIALFLLFTGLVAQLLGGVGAPLTLNNQGLYYGLYYTTQADLQAHAWLRAHIPATLDVRSASHAKAIMHDPTYPFNQLGILPTQRSAASYVYLNQAQTIAQKFYTYHQGSALITTFPLTYYSDHTNQIYSTTTTGVYH